MVLAAGTARAGRVLIDRIVALVDDEAVFQSDIDEMVRQYMFQQRVKTLSDKDRDAVSRRALDDLINDKLVIAEAARLNVDIPFADVEKKVDEAIADNMRMLGGEDAFHEQLKNEGFTLEGLKRLYRRQWKNRMLVERVLRQEMHQSRKGPSEADLRKFYNDHKEDIPARPAVVHLKTIFLGFDEASEAGTTAHKKIEEIHRRLLAGEAFDDLARKYSDDPSSSNGGDLGFLKPGDLGEPAFRAAVAKLAVGEVSDPVRTTYGWHIIEVTEERPKTGELHVRHILVRVEPTEGDIDKVFKRATALHDSLMAGAVFDSLADRYGNDPAAGPGGDLGWLKVNELPAFFRDVLKSLKPGDVSQVLRESAGFRIVKLLAREPARPYAISEIRDNLVKLWQQQQMAKEYDTYIASLRKKFKVVMR